MFRNYKKRLLAIRQSLERERACCTHKNGKQILGNVKILEIYEIFYHIHYEESNKWKLNLGRS